MPRFWPNILDPQYDKERTRVKQRNSVPFFVTKRASERSYYINYRLIRGIWRDSDICSEHGLPPKIHSNAPNKMSHQFVSEEYLFADYCTISTVSSVTRHSGKKSPRFKSLELKR
jgi:hypothetical protein